MHPGTLDKSGKSEQQKRHAWRAFFIAASQRLTATPIIAPPQCKARPVIAARCVVAAAVLIMAAEAALLAAWLSKAAVMPPESLVTASPRVMHLAFVAVRPFVPLTFLASYMAMTTVRRIVVKRNATSISVRGKAVIAIGAEAAAISTAKSSSTATARAVVAARTVRRGAGAQLVLGFQTLDSVHLDVLLGIAFDALQ